MISFIKTKGFTAPQLAKSNCLLKQRWRHLIAEKPQCVERKRDGFTIVELLMVLSAITLLSAMMFANYRQGVRQTDLQNAANELIAVLRHSQASAASGVQYNGLAVTDYRLYFATASNDSYKVCAGSVYCAGNVVETVNFPPEVFLQSITLEPATSAAKVDVIFKSPFGDIQFNGDTFSNQTTRILDLVLSNGTQTVTVKIDPISGRIFYE